MKTGGTTLRMGPLWLSTALLTSSFAAGCATGSQTESEAAVPGLQLAAAAAPAVRVPLCGTERWNVKIGTDPEMGHVNPAGAQPTDVKSLRSLPAPRTLPPTDRLEPQEDQVWTVTATVVEVKLEADRDLHLVLADPTNSALTMIAEIPDPTCVPPSDAWSWPITEARRAFDQYRPGNAWVKVGRPASLTGVEFFDVLHGQRGVAPNGIELHPLLHIQWLGP